MQALSLLALDPIAATLAEPNSAGFRLGRAPADAIDQCQRVWSRRWSTQWIVEGDIHSGFDRISPAWFLANIPMEKAILRQSPPVLSDPHVLSPTTTGVPQGGRASPVLRNLTLHGLARHIRGALHSVPRQSADESPCAQVCRRLPGRRQDPGSPGRSCPW